MPQCHQRGLKSTGNNRRTTSFLVTRANPCSFRPLPSPSSSHLLLRPFIPCLPKNLKVCSLKLASDASLPSSSISNHERVHRVIIFPFLEPFLEYLVLTLSPSARMREIVHLQTGQVSNQFIYRSSAASAYPSHANLSSPQQCGNQIGTQSRLRYRGFSCVHHSYPLFKRCQVLGDRV